MKRFLQFSVLAACLLLLSATLAFSDDIVSAGSQGSPIKASWSLSTTWAGGTVPGPNDNVTIFDGDTVIIDVSASVVNLTVGSGTSGALIFNSTASVNLTISGDFVISANAAFRCTGGTSAPVIDSIIVSGNFMNYGSTLDMRTGSGPNYGVGYIIFVGNTNSSFRTTTPYNSNTNEFNGITIMKSGNANVILGSDITMAGGSSTYPATQPYLDLRHGFIVTGNYSIINRSTAANTPNPVIVGGSDTSYVLGSFGRGMSSTSVTTRTFPVGDNHGFHPIQVHNASGGGATGHNLRVRLIFGNANPSASALSGGIDKVSTARYYKLTYDRGVGADTTTTSASMSFDRFMPSYTQQDGVGAGNSNLRVGYTTDSLINWKGMGQVVTPDTTVYTNPPTYWKVDSLPTASWVTLQYNHSAYVALARATGTTDNTLDFTLVGVIDRPGLPTGFTLSQNYPNPFNPTTTIVYTVPKTSHVTIEVFNLLGQSVAHLVDRTMHPGTYTANLDASGFTTGIYFYRLTAGSTTLTHKMVVTK